MIFASKVVGYAVVAAARAALLSNNLAGFVSNVNLHYVLNLIGVLT